MKLTVLGRSGGFPRPGEATSGYLLEASGRCILLDCGSGVLSRLLQKIPVTQLDLVVLSHLHHDHTADLGVLQFAISMTRKFGTDIPVLPVMLPEEPESLRPSSTGVFDLRFIVPDRPVTWNGITLTFVPGRHPVPSFAVRVAADGRLLAYTGDTAWCDRVPDMVRGADLAVMDAGGLERARTDPMVHLTARECAAAAREGGVRRVVLSHLVPFFDTAETLAEAQKEGGPAELALPMAEYEI